MELTQKDINRLTINELIVKHHLSYNKARTIKKEMAARVTINDIVKHAINGYPIESLPDKPGKTIKKIFGNQHDKFCYDDFVKILKLLNEGNQDINVLSYKSKITSKNLKKWQTALQFQD